MLIFVDSQYRIQAVHHSDNPELVSYETNMFDAMPLAQVCCYCYERLEKGESMYPYVDTNAQGGLAAIAQTQEALLGSLGVPVDNNMEGHAEATRQAMDHAGKLIPEEDAFDYKALYPIWTADAEYKTDDRVQDTGFLYKARKDHTAQENWRPPEASLWIRLDEKHKGTKDDPIPAALGMVYNEGKFYVEDMVLYRCTRDSVEPLYHMPSQLVGHYFEVVEN